MVQELLNQVILIPNHRVPEDPLVLSHLVLVDIPAHSLRALVDSLAHNRRVLVDSLALSRRVQADSLAHSRRVQADILVPNRQDQADIQVVDRSQVNNLDNSQEDIQVVMISSQDLNHPVREVQVDPVVSREVQVDLVVSQEVQVDPVVRNQVVLVDSQTEKGRRDRRSSQVVVPKVIQVEDQAALLSPVDLRDQVASPAEGLDSPTHPSPRKALRSPIVNICRHVQVKNNVIIEEATAYNKYDAVFGAKI